MPLTDIERALFGHLDFSNESAFVKKLLFAESAVSLDLIAMPGDRSVAVARFSKSVIKSMWFAEGETIEFPLDLMHLTCCKLPDLQWEFALNCGSVEIIWESCWPAIELSPPQAKLGSTGANGAGAPAS